MKVAAANEAPPSAPAQPAPAPRFGRYQLISRVGRGGMAEAWKATLVGPLQFQRMVVIKRILAHLSDQPSFVKMFVDEARLGAYLTHPTIVNVFDFGNVDGVLFLAMELVDGFNLGEVLTNIKPHPPVGLSLYIVRELATALSYAYEVRDSEGVPLRIVHRDISPSNVMLARDGSVKLLDFGIAKALGAPGEPTKSGTLKGKFSYMAPEFIEGQPFDHRCDIFALGVVMHEMLTGQRLFRRETDVHTLTMVRNCEVAPPSKINPDVRPEIDAIALRALARDPSQRYQHADDLVADLDRVLHELKWGRRETTALLRERFADHRSPPEQTQPTRSNESVEIELGAVEHTHSTVASLVGPARRGRAARHRPGKAAIGLALVALVALFAVATAVVGRRGSSVNARTAERVDVHSSTSQHNQPPATSVLAVAVPTTQARLPAEPHRDQETAVRSSLPASTGHHSKRSERHAADHAFASTQASTTPDIDSAVY